MSQKSSLPQAAKAVSHVLMSDIPVPSVDPVFLAVVGFHIVVGIACVAAGVMGMLSHKGRGRHSTFGTLYY